MTNAARKRAVIVKSFTDAGTRERFTSGETALIDAGAFGNYEAAGLIRAATAEPKSASKTRVKTTRRPARPAAGKPAVDAVLPPPAPSVEADASAE